MPGRGRGRGRGQGARGGSRGRGRGGRGGSRGRGFGARGRSRVTAIASDTKPTDEWGVDKQEVDETLDIDTNLKQFFVGTASFEQHYRAQQQNRRRYAAGLQVMKQNGVEVSQSKFSVSRCI